jgi:hypothetical protein
VRHAWLWIGLVACNGSTSTSVPAVDYTGTLPASVPARHIFNTLEVQASIGKSMPRLIVVDTGSPLAGVDPASWPDADLSPTFSTLPTFTVGSLTFEQVPAAPLSICGTMCGPFDPTGVLGGNVLREFVMGFDYQAPAVLFGPSAVPSDAQTSPVTVAIDVAGGGMGTVASGDSQVYDVPPTRLVLSVVIEGTTHTLAVDTGATYTTLRASLFSQIVADGRATLPFDAATTTGGAQSQVARSRTMSVGSAQATGSPIASIDDSVIDSLASEIGQSADGLLGGSFLRAYYTRIDYGGQQLSLYPFKTADPLADEFDRVGVFLAEDGAGYAIGQAVTASAQSLVGDTLVDVDGTSVTGLDPDQADRLLRGTPGGSHTLHVQQNGTVDAVTLPIEDVLALMP